VAHKVISVISVNRSSISEVATPNQTSAIMISIAMLQTFRADATLVTAALIIVISETASTMLETVASATALAAVEMASAAALVALVAVVLASVAALVAVEMASAEALVAALVAVVMASVAALVAGVMASVMDLAVVLLAASVDSEAVVMVVDHFPVTVDSADEAADSVALAVHPKYFTLMMMSVIMRMIAIAATSECELSLIYNSRSIN